VTNKFEKGSAALVVLVSEGHLHVANLGDCQLLGVLKEEEMVKKFTAAHNLANQQ
jgi:serine/threonine protein phosphatase PrpC